MRITREQLRRIIREELQITSEKSANIPQTTDPPRTKAVLLKGNALAADPDFQAKVQSIAASIGASPADLMAIMKFESGLDPSKVNKSSGATGLIQFMPATAQGLGTSTGELQSMTGVEQMEYVAKYFEGSGPYRSPTDLYLKVFYPYAIRQSDDYVIGSEVSDERAREIADANPSFPKNDAGFITKRAIIDKMEPRFAGPRTAARIETDKQ